MANTKVAVDVGGTFTDICIMDEETGRIRIEKTASTPDDPMRAIMNGIDQAGIDLSDVSMFSHGTTVATNALITRNLPRAAMVCTEGFRDVVEIRRANKEDLWDTYKDVAKPYIPRRDRLTVRERISVEGEVLTELDEDDAYRVAHILKKRGVAAIAVCFMNSYVNGANEERMRDILVEIMPDVPVSISSQIMPEHLRARAVLDHDGQCGRIARGGRLRRPPVGQARRWRLRARTAAAPYRGRRDDHQGGARLRRPAGRVRASPRERSPAGSSDRSAAIPTRSASTWAARRPTSRSPTRESRGSPRLVHRIRLSDPVPVD